MFIIVCVLICYAVLPLFEKSGTKNFWKNFVFLLALRI